MERIASITRDTNETQISMSLNLDGSGRGNISTGIGFFDHMLNSFARHGFFDLDLTVKGDLEVDTHHHRGYGNRAGTGYPKGGRG